LLGEKFIAQANGHYNITNLGALLFAKNLGSFDHLARKAIRVIQYEGTGKLKTLKDQFGQKGYVVGFDGLLNYISGLLPSNEEIGKAFRREVRMYPEVAIRELVANAIIHQDFRESGISPMVEIYADRIEISNPGNPMVDTKRFIDEYQSRNELLASAMRRTGLCEEKGSGIDKVIAEIELFQLPAPDFQVKETHTKAVVYAPQQLTEMDRKDKTRACYQHCCLKFVTNKKMTNQTLRDRFKIEDKNYSAASRIIRDTIEEGLIKEQDPENKSKKHISYIPFWA
jgi:ATP-dependent DNA helicase RecG